MDPLLTLSAAGTVDNVRRLVSRAEAFLVVIGRACGGSAVSGGGGNSRSTRARVPARSPGHVGDTHHPVLWCTHAPASGRRARRVSADVGDPRDDWIERL
jgi:hypothetical protein